MPEGPEIRRAADKVAKVVEGKTIESVEIGLDRIKQYAKQLEASRVRNIETRGKALLTHFECGLSVYSHNQLYGVWRVAKRGKLPETKRSLRFAIHTQTHSAVLYSASDISVWQGDEIYTHPLVQKLGPDILSPSLTWQTVAERLQSKKFCNRAVSGLYLDQSFIAGLGNYLRSEILFAAGIHPDKKPNQLNQAQICKLAQVTQAITQRAYKTGGYTVPDDLLSKLNEAENGYEGVRFMAFNREQLPCRECAFPIERASRNSRRIYWCRDCQPK